jgi:hypothetical protein
MDTLIKKFQKLRTEDTGKMFEMAICLAYKTPYDGVYKYEMETPRALAPRLEKLTTLFPACVHTAKKGARYDFTVAAATETETIKQMHLSAKTTKKGIGKVAPQVIGQCQPSKLCEMLKIDYTDTIALKRYLQEHIATVLPVLAEHTFDCPNVFYHQQKNTIQYITLDKPIVWGDYTYTWSRPWDKWRNSAILKVASVGAEEKPVPLMEFQFHSKSRTNVAIRWFYGNVLTRFKDAFTTVEL